MHRTFFAIARLKALFAKVIAFMAHYYSVLKSSS